MQSKITVSQILPYLISVLCVAGCIAAVALLAVPWVQDFRELTAQTENEKKKVETIIKPKIKVLSAQDETILQQNFELAITGLPQETDSLGLMNTLERFGKAYGVDLQGVSYAGSGQTASSATAVSASSDVAGFNLSTSADYATLMAMVAGFENLLPINTAPTIRFSKGQTETSDIGFSITLNFHSQPATINVSETTIIQGLTSDEEDALVAIEEMKNYPLVPIYQNIGKDNPFTR